MRKVIILLLVIVLSLCLVVPAMAASVGDQIDTTVTEYTAYEQEVLTTLGNIWGILIFFVVVILCYFTYKFFRIFF